MLLRLWYISKLWTFPLQSAPIVFTQVLSFKQNIFRSFVDYRVGQIMTVKSSRVEFLLDKKLFASNSLLRAQKYFLFASRDTANQITGNPGTTVVFIGHWTSWRENPQYRIQVWGKMINNDKRALI